VRLPGAVLSLRDGARLILAQDPRPRDGRIPPEEP